MRYFKLGVLLCVFWFILSGHTTPLLLSLGIASVLLVIWLMHRMERKDQSPARMIFSLEFVSYVGWLAWQVLVANIDVARRIWDPDLPIEPSWRKIKVSLKQPLLKTIYANSITLTPGTVTTEVGEDYFVVHALNAASIDELQAGAMEKRLLRLESKA